MTMSSYCDVISTIFSVEQDFCLDLFLLFQCFLNFGFAFIFGVLTVQELTGTAFTHDVGPGVSGKLAESIGAIDYRKTVR